MSSQFDELDEKIRQRQGVRLQARHETEKIAEREKQASLKATQARLNSMQDFVQAFNEWQSKGYTFGQYERKIEFESSLSLGKNTFRAHVSLDSFGDRKERRFGSVKTFVEIDLGEDLDPSGYRPPGPPPSPDGVLVQATLQEYHSTLLNGREEDGIKTIGKYQRFFGMKELDKIEEALIPMLEVLLDNINSPEFGREFTQVDLGGPA